MMLLYTLHRHMLSKVQAVYLLKLVYKFKLYKYMTNKSSG